LAEALVTDLDPNANRLPHERLSQREFEVLRLLASGKAVSEIAEMLSLSDKTVSTYRGRILEKLQLKTTADLVRYALEHSLID
jgi:DNA-binding NarL/FixJ family response regulator